MKLPTVQLPDLIPNTKGIMKYEDGRPKIVLETDFYVLINIKAKSRMGLNTIMQAFPVDCGTRFPRMIHFMQGRLVCMTGATQESFSLANLRISSFFLLCALQASRNGSGT